MRYSQNQNLENTLNDTAFCHLLEINTYCTKTIIDSAETASN